MRIEAERITVNRGGRRLLHDVSFSTGGSGFFILFGKSGSGKTTLLRLINRLDEPDRGRILVGGTPVREYAPTALRRQVGMIFQEPRLLDGTVEENILFAARCHGLDVDVDDLLARVGLPGTARRQSGSLSGGEQQRVAVARALAVGPRVLLLDEPTSSLDRPAALAVEELLRGLASSGGLHLLFVTHSESQIRRLGAPGIVLSGGTVAYRGDIAAWLGGAP